MQLNSYSTNAADQQKRSDNAIRRCYQSDENDRECDRRCIDFVNIRSENSAFFARLIENKHENRLNVQDEIENIGEKRYIADN